MDHLDRLEDKDEEGNLVEQEKWDLQVVPGYLVFPDHRVHQGPNRISSHFWNKSNSLKEEKKDHHLIHFPICRHRLDQSDLEEDLVTLLNH